MWMRSQLHFPIIIIVLFLSSLHTMEGWGAFFWWDNRLICTPALERPFHPFTRDYYQSAFLSSYIEEVRKLSASSTSSSMYILTFKPIISRRGKGKEIYSPIKYRLVGYK
ncbi:hypothetical protein BDV41DRAFT_518141 [Aspergillus transmontanensis]|uniref:Uncharacterized protein n=1 Tax=Aspergillus transmontanensis TaxID=1034304 RepID=A0A5N6WGF2_9EURO|nr:hypothetical protein BDV41DRAFT_518141 [Aspergillus transmontanensis]